MNDTPRARLAVIGVSSMGSSHVKDIATRLPNTQLAAVCDIDRQRATWRGEGGCVLLNQGPHHLDLYH